MEMRRGEERVQYMETCITLCKIDNGNLLYGSGNSNRGSGSISRGVMGWEMGGRSKKKGIYVYLWMIHFEV